MSIDGLVSLVIYLLVVGAILWLLLWIIGKFPLVAPFDVIARGVVYVVGALILINMLLGFVGHPVFNLR